MTFGEKLFKLRKERGLSQEALAEQANTTRQAISKWENNQGFPETEKLMLLSNIFEVSIDSLLKDSESTGTQSTDGYYAVSYTHLSFYLFINIRESGLSSAQASEMILDKAHVLLLPGNAFGRCGEGYLRLACTVGIQKLGEAFDRIEKITLDK